MLKHLDDIEHVLLLYDSENLKSGTMLNSMAAPCVGIVEPEDKIHCQLMMGPVAGCLHTFTSKKKLMIQAFIDVVTGACIQTFPTYTVFTLLLFFCSTSDGLQYKRDLAQRYQHQQYNVIQSGPSIYFSTNDSASLWLVDQL
jgi:hypothetical protein